jgi:hypothetical protein
VAILIKCNATDVLTEGEIFSGELLVEKPVRLIEGDEVFIWTSERPRQKPNGKGLELRGRLLSSAQSDPTGKAKIKVQISDRLPEMRLNMDGLAEIGRKSAPAHGLHERIHKFRPRRIWTLDEEEREVLSSFFEQDKGFTQLQIRWNNPDSVGWTDHLPMKFFSKIGATIGLIHTCAGPHGEDLDAKCDVQVHDQYADLDYSNHKKFNQAREIFLGVTRIHFEKGNRRNVRLVEWSNLKTSNFENLFPTISFVEDGPNAWDIDLLGMAAEGSTSLVSHLRRERDTKLVESKKNFAQANGKLICEACEFDFEQRYGKLGSGFCEVHHTKPLAEGERVTSLADLAILCSNCHRMIHRTSPMMSVDAFRQMHLKPARRVG